MLSMLQQVSGLDSAYLTTIDLDRDEQRILYSHNAGEMDIPEGLAVPWADTLCKRALEEGRPFTPNVSQCWGDSDAAKALGIETYLSSPIRLGNGELYGTLCAASHQSQDPSPDVKRLLALFATLIAHNVERERLLGKLTASNEALAALARTDELTGLHNRRALLEELGRMLAKGKRSGMSVFVAFVDLDGLKAVNDSYGHEVGDALIAQVAEALRTNIRGEDLAARIGGDEYVVVGPGPSQANMAMEAGAVFRDRVAAATKITLTKGNLLLDYPGASVGLTVVQPGEMDAAQALDAADADMYQVKRERRYRRLGVSDSTSPMTQSTPGRMPL